MVNKLKLFILLVLAFPLNGISQHQEEPFDSKQLILLKGEVFSQENGEKVPFVHIVNKNSNLGTYSDLNGNFEIFITSNDTIVFSAVGYKKIEFTLSEIDFSLQEYKIKIFLDISYIQLSTVDIYAFKDEAVFKRDILNLQLPETPKYIIDLPQSQFLSAHDINPSLTLGGPISAIQNIFSKEAREHKKYAEALNEAPNQEIIRKKFNRKIIEDVTGLKEEGLSEFILYCKITDDFILKSSEYEIIEMINSCYKSFLTSRN